MDPCSPLGEYEQAIPVIKEIKKSFVDYKTVLSFFSNSGFDIIKDKSICDLTILLPLDTIKNAKNFIDLVNPKMVLFVKYEFWPNYLNYLNKKNIPTFLIMEFLEMIIGFLNIMENGLKKDY